jgi:hypothetical protein
MLAQSTAGDAVNAAMLTLVTAAKLSTLADLRSRCAEEENGLGEPGSARQTEGPMLRIIYIM